MSKINDIDELPEGIVSYKQKTTDQHQQRDPSLFAKGKTICKKMVLLIDKVIWIFTV